MFEKDFFLLISFLVDLILIPHNIGQFWIKNILFQDITIIYKCSWCVRHFRFWWFLLIINITWIILHCICDFDTFWIEYCVFFDGVSIYKYKFSKLKTMCLIICCEFWSRVNLNHVFFKLFNLIFLFKITITITIHYYTATQLLFKFIFILEVVLQRHFLQKTSP